jgi:flagellar basal-body rod modification protein FlgD
MLSMQSAGLQNAEVVSLVGKQATVKGSMVSIDGTGVGASIGFKLSGNAEETTITIRDSAGRLVRTMELGAKSAGTTRLMWDGQNNAGIVQPAGTYTVEVDAKTADGAAVAATQETSGTVTGVSFDKGYPVLHLDNGSFVPVSDLLRVDSPPPANP